MTDVVSLILRGNPRETVAMPPMLIKHKVAWRSVDAPKQREDYSEIRHTEISEAVNDDLKPVLDHCDAGNPIPWEKLQDIGERLYNDVVNVDGQRVLSEAGKAEKPVLLVNSVRGWDWIPWEIMYDEELNDFLGLKFQITRLPILTAKFSPIRETVPDLTNGQVHQVQHIRNLLGKDVLDGAPTAVRDDWLNTFDGTPAGISLVHLPQTPDGAAVWPIKDDARDFNAHIVHITCHGTKDTRGEWVWSLSLQKVNPLKHHLDKSWVRRRDLTETGPLVFGNACGALDGSSPRQLFPTFGPFFLQAGAPNFIGSFGPLRREVALKFARTFYKYLLKQNKPIGEALLAAKQDFRNQQAINNPCYLFYCLYGLPTTRYAFKV